MTLEEFEEELEEFDLSAFRGDDPEEMREGIKKQWELWEVATAFGPTAITSFLEMFREDFQWH